MYYKIVCMTMTKRIMRTDKFDFVCDDCPWTQLFTLPAAPAAATGAVHLLKPFRFLCVFFFGFQRSRNEEKAVCHALIEKCKTNQRIAKTNSWFNEKKKIQTDVSSRMVTVFFTF